MRFLSEKQFEAEVAPILHQTFVHLDLYAPFLPFLSHVEERVLLHPFYSVLGRREIPIVDAVAVSAQAIGDVGCYLSIIGRPSAHEQKVPFHWYFDFTEIKPLQKHIPPFKGELSSLDYTSAIDHVMCSPSGQWGFAVFNDGGFAQLGGSSAFFQSIRKEMPGFDDISQVHEFLEVWKYYATKRGADVSWVPKLLVNIYGNQLARELLSKTSFNDVL